MVSRRGAGWCSTRTVWLKASKGGEPFGYERLAQVLRGTSGLSGTALNARVLKSLTAFTGGAPLADDLTLVVVERGG